MRRVLPLLLLTSWLLIAAPAWPAFAGATDYPAPGSLGYGVTVYQGHERARFEVEILGVLERTGSTGDVILARLAGEPLERTGVLQGMSGSPVWVDGQLIGAVAATWAFVTEPIAAIRPIGEMRRLGAFLEAGKHPTWQPGQLRASAPSRAGMEGVPLELQRGDLRAVLEQSISALVPDSEDAARSVRDDALELWPLPNSGGLAWTASGFAPSVRAALEQRIGSAIAPGFVSSASGISTPELDGELAGADDLDAGDALAVLLVDGDARLASVGTVTERDGDTILAFGHPFLGVGPLSLPMARAEVVTLLPSRQISTKIASPGAEIGALLLDRSAGVSGRLGVRADMLPVQVTVIDPTGQESRFRYRVAREASLSAALTYWTVQSSLLMDQDIAGQIAADVEITLRLAGQEPLLSRASMSGLGIGGQLAPEVMLPINLLAFNPRRAETLQGVDVRIALRQGLHDASIGRVLAQPARPEAGDELTLRVELLPFREAPRWIESRVRIPASLAAGRYVLHVSDGAQAFQEELLRAKGRWSHAGLEEIREALALRRPASELRIVLYGPPQAALVRGTELERLPGSVRGILSRSQGASAAGPVAATPLLRQGVETSWVLRGSASIPLDLGPEADAPPTPENR